MAIKIVHFGRNKLVANCGAHKANQTLTTILDQATCSKCLKIEFKKQKKTK